MISYVNSQFVNVAGTGADVTIPSPAGTVAGDLLLFVAVQDGLPAGLNVADVGWKGLGNIAVSLPPGEALFFYRFASASDPAAWTITGTPTSGQLQILIAAYHTTNARGLVVDAWQQGSFSTTPMTAWTAYASTTREDTVIAVATSSPTGTATMLAPTGFTTRHTEGTFVVADKDEATVGQFQYPAALTAAAQWAAAALSVHERDPAPANESVLAAVDLNLVGQVRTIRRINATTNGALSTPGTAMPGTSVPVTNSVWFRIVVPADTTGPMRFGIPSAGEDFDQHRSALYRALILWRLNGVDPTNSADMQNLDSSYNRIDDGLHNNCEGYAQGRDTYLVEWAAGGGEVYYLQVATFSNVDSIDDDFTLEWVYDPLPEPTEMTGTKTPSNCPGTPLTTYGFQIAYYDAISGFPARFSPGRSIPHAPPMPVVGHAFYVEDVREFANVHIRRIIVGWTEATGPFLYGYVDRHGWARTWTADNEDPVGHGAASLLGDGSVHQGIIFYDNPTHAAALSTIRTIAGLGDKNPSYDWAAPAGGSGDMAWGGPGRPGSFFEESFSPLEVNEWALDGSHIGTYSLRSFIWCSLDGTELYGIEGTALKAYNIAGGTERVIAASGYALNQGIYGVRSSDGHIVMNSDAAFGITQVAVVDPATGTATLYSPPTRPSDWAITFGRHWNPLGVTADGQHLFFMLFYPLTYPVPHVRGGREFVSDVWWMDLDTGVCEHKFFLSHPFHDTNGVLDTVPAPPTTNVRDVRLYRQADVGR